MHKNKEKVLSELYSRYDTLNKLPVDTSAATRFVPGNGNPNAHIMLIGEAPGQQEDAQGAPFAGRSGQLLIKALNQAGLKRDDVFITNTVKCRPPGNRTPTPQEINFFKDLLAAEIETVQPDLILLVGAVATHAVLGIDKISPVRGKIIERNGIAYMPIYHPAYILRSPDKYHILAHDIAAAVAWSKNSHN